MKALHEYFAQIVLPKYKTEYIVEGSVPPFTAIGQSRQNDYEVYIDYHPDKLEIVNPKESFNDVYTIAIADPQMIPKAHAVLAEILK